MSGHHWKKVAKRYPPDYENWGNRLYQEQIQTYLERDSLSYHDLNWIFQSPYYVDSLYEILYSLPIRLDKMSNFENIELPEIFFQSKTVNAFKNTILGQYETDNFLRVFEALPLEETFPIVDKSVSHYPIEEQALEYDNALKYVEGWWKNDYLMNNYRDTIFQIITQYSEQKTRKVHHFDETRFFLNHYQLPIKEQLKTLETTQKKQLAKKICRKIFDLMSYEELPTMLNYAQKNPDLVYYDLILHYDFDIYIPNFTLDSIPVLIENIEKMDINTLRLHYLKQMGVDLDLKNEISNYKKIYELLKFSYNSDYLSMLMGVLETHFQDKFKMKMHTNYDFLEEEHQLIQWLSFFEQNGWAEERLKNRKSILEMNWEAYEYFKE